MVPIEIKNFPMPPSANSLYKNIASGRAKTEKYLQYEQQVKIWTYKYGYQLTTARLYIQDRNPGEVFHLERTFYFHQESILTKKMTPKKNDTSNRIKALDDVLGQLLGIDDSHFWDGEFKKRVSKHPAFGEYVDIKINTMPIILTDDED